MRQRISVRAIIREEDSILLLRRATGRQSILGQYELPGGKLAYREQPEDALQRYLRDDAGLQTSSFSLKDVLTYMDADDQSLQYVFIIYDVTVKNTAVHLSRNYDQALWAPSLKLQQSQLTESTKLLLNLSTHPTYLYDKGVDSTTAKRFVVFSDGGSRGNPGPSAAGFVILDMNETVIDEGGEYLGITTNNIAEYQAAHLGLKRALVLGADAVDFRMDSLLVVNQLNGIFKIKNRELWPIHERIKLLEKKFKRVTYSHVKREYNQLADGMVNKILDEHEKKA